MDIKFEKYLQKLNKSDIEEYPSCNIPYSESLMGMRLKKFIRLNSEVLGELIHELKSNPNCSYDTYVNDVIIDGYIPNYISVLIKYENIGLNGENRYELDGFADVIASRFLNYFECPTTYETCVKIKNNICSCSVDFGRYGEDFYPITNFTSLAMYGSLGLVDKFLENIDKALYDFKKENMKTLSDDDFNKMIAKFNEDYVYSWLIRFLLLNDRDFALNNVGFIHNKELNTIRMAPNFDMERCFTKLNMGIDTSIQGPKQKLVHKLLNAFTQVEDAQYLNKLEFLAKNYPHVLAKFNAKLQGLKCKTNSKTFTRNIIESVIGGGSENAEALINNLQKRINTIDKMLSKLDLVK